MSLGAPSQERQLHARRSTVALAVGIALLAHALVLLALAWMVHTVKLAVAPTPPPQTAEGTLTRFRVSVRDRVPSGAPVPQSNAQGANAVRTQAGHRGADETKPSAERREAPRAIAEEPTPSEASRGQSPVTAAGDDTRIDTPRSEVVLDPKPLDAPGAEAHSAGALDPKAIDAPGREAPSAVARPGASSEGSAAPGEAHGSGGAAGDGRAAAFTTGSGDAPRGEVPVSATVLAQLHARLQASADRCYPAAARRYRLGGEALLHFCSDGRGGFDSTSLARGTDSALLDGAATDCVLPGAAPLPEGLGGCFTVPLRFGAR